MKAAATVRVARGGLALLLAVVTGGCGMWTRGPKVGFSDEVVRTHAEQRPSEPVTAEVSQDGRRVQVTASHVCERIQVHEVQRTHEYDRQSTAQSWMIGFALAGAALIGTGAYLLATADDRPERASPGSDELTQDNARFAGAAGVGLGGVGLTAAGIHWAVVAREDTETEMLEREGEVVKRRVECSPREPGPGVAVWLMTSTGRTEVGVTDHDGLLVVNLSEVVERSAVVGATWEQSATVGADQDAVARVDLTPVRDWYDNRTWARAEPQQCASPDDSADCKGVERYLEDFPEGAHAQEAKELLVEARAVLKKIAEREEAERKAEAERRRKLEEERRAAAERERLEAERRRQELEAQRRAAEERYRRELERRQEAGERQREKAARQARERRERKKCRAKCRRSCKGDAACRRECVRSQCR